MQRVGPSLQSHVPDFVIGKWEKFLPSRSVTSWGMHKGLQWACVQVLIIVVVLSMALTPSLAQVSEGRSEGRKQGLANPLL